MGDAFDRAQDSVALAIYDEHVRSASAPAQAALLRARIALRTPGQAAKALPLLKTLHPPANGSEFVSQQMLMGQAYAATGEFAMADDRLQRALQVATQKGDAELIAAVGYRIGERHVLDANAQRAREGLALAKAGRSTESKLASQVLESDILEGESRWHDRARLLIRMLSSIDPKADKYMGFRIAGTFALSVCARESYVPDAVRAIERQLGGIPWPDDYADRHFLTARALAWTRALGGDYFNAFRYLRERADSAPNDAWRTIAFCDRAYLAHARNERTWFEQELFEAQRTADAVKWEVCEDESILSLPLLAELTASIDPSRASKYLNRFKRIADGSEKLPFLQRQPRFHALVDYASGVVDLHHGERKRAAGRFEGAREIYRTIAFEWRAARCDLRLFDVTRKTAFLQDAHRWLGNYPKS
ncbi:MAG TPA: hypothetical protein VGF18_07030, partial [Candidatus Tumulicola sp.]